MTSYERKLDEFAEGKNLIRLSRPVRDRADATCDACGSTQPRILYALKDQDSERYHFVGVTCLEELVRRGVIRRRFGRESGQVAFEEEMKRRAEEPKSVSVAGTDGAAAPQELIEPHVDGQVASSSGAPTLFPVVLVVETPEHYKAFAHIVTGNGTSCAFGYAEEPRYEEVWQRVGDRGLILERGRRERTQAFDQSISLAWRDAHSRVEDAPALAPLWKHLAALRPAELPKALLSQGRISQQPFDSESPCAEISPTAGNDK